MKVRKIVLAALFGTTQAAFAITPYTLDATVNTQNKTFGFSNVEEAIDSLKTENLSTFFSSYTGNEAVNVDMDFRGLPVNMGYPTANSTTLAFAIPSLGINRTFTGTTRDESESQLRDFLKNGDVLGQIMQKLAEVSPIDPIAGNPNSAMSKMVANDFNNGFLSPASNIATGPNKDTSSNNLAGIGLRFGQYKQAGYSSSDLSIPLSYTIRSDIDPRRQLVINMPISQSEVEGAKSYYGGAGFTYRLPMNDEWSLAPSFNYAVTGSKDLGSVAQIVSGSIASTYVFRGDNASFAIGNMVGYYKTLKLSTNGYSFDPEISNTVFRNGLLLSQPASVGGRNMSIEYSLIDTRFTGTKLYNNGYDELGITLGTNKSAGAARSYLRAGLTYLYSPKSKGFTLNLGYWF